MGITPHSFGEGGTSLPPVKPTLLQQAGTGIFELLDVPGNVTRSLAVGDVKNALAAALPFWEARRVPGSEVTGKSDEEAFWTNLAVEVLADPLLFVNQIGKLPKGAQALRKVATVSRELKHTRNLLSKLPETAKGIEQIKELEKLLEASKAAYKGLSKAEKADKSRRLVTLGIPFGRRLGIPELDIGRIRSRPFLTPAKTAQQTRILARKQKALGKIEKELAKLDDYHKKYGYTPRMSLAEKMARESVEIRNLMAGEGFVSAMKGAITEGKFGKGFREAVYGTTIGADRIDDVIIPLYDISMTATKTQKAFIEDIMSRAFEKASKKYWDGWNPWENSKKFVKKRRPNATPEELFNGIIDNLSGEISSPEDLVKMGFELDDVLKEVLPKLKGDMKKFGIKFRNEVLGAAIPLKLSQRPISKTMEQRLLKQQANLIESIERSEKFGDKLVTGILGIKGTEALRKSIVGKTGRFLERKFRFGAKDPDVEMIRDVYKTQTAQALALNERQHLEMIDLIENIAKARNMSVSQVEERLVKLAENPYFLNQAAVDPKLNQAIKIKELQKDMSTKLNKLNKDYSKVAKKGDRAKITEFARKADKLVEDMATKTHKIKSEAERVRLQLDEFKRIMGDILPEEEQFISNYVRSLEQFVPIAKELGVKVDFLQSSKGMTKYLPRMITKEAQKLKKTHPTIYKRVMNEFNARYAGAARRKLHPELAIGEVNKLMREELGINYDIFRTDIANIITERRAHMLTVLNRGAAINSFVDSMGVTRKSQAGRRAWTADRLFERFGMDGSVAPKKYISRTLVDDLDKIKTFFGNDLAQDKELSRTFFAYLNATNAVFQPALTTAFPAYHHRNLLNNIAMNIMAGVRGVKHYAEGARLQRLAAAGKLAGKDLDLWIELNQVGAVRAGQYEVYKRFIEQTPENWRKFLTTITDTFERPVSSFITNPLRELVGKPVKQFRREQFNLFTGRAYGSFIEENSRIAHYLSKRADGLSRIESMRSVNKWLFDYDRLTDFEKQAIRPWFLFYTWSRNNIPLMLKTAITNPRYMSIYTKLTGLGDEEVPQYLNRGFAFKAPPGVGSNEYFGSLGLGFEDLNLFNVGAADPNKSKQAQRFAFNILMRLNPALKIPAEQIAFSKDFFTGREMSDLTTGERWGRALPTSRFASTYEKLFDPSASGISKFVDFMTGIRTYHVDPDVLRRDILNRRAMATGKFKRGRGLELRREYKESATAKRLDKELRRALREVNKK